jgi:hypothetical protein
MHNNNKSERAGILLKDSPKRLVLPKQLREPCRCPVALSPPKRGRQERIDGLYLGFDPAPSAIGAHDDSRGDARAGYIGEGGRRKETKSNKYIKQPS